MLNYIKSECYRITHTKEIYLVTGILAALTVLMNVVLYLFNASQEIFSYGNVRYSLNLLTGSLNTMLIMACVIVSFVFGEEHKNGTLKNVVAYGISRSTFFTGKCIVSGIMAFFSMAVILICYIGSAYLLLESNSPEPLQELLKGVGAALPSALASLVMAVAAYTLIKKEGLAIVIWLLFIWAVPNVCFTLGLKIDFLNKAAEWMPFNFLRFETAVSLTDYNCLWNTPEGLAKCMIAGAVGIAVFYIAGILLFRKRDIA